ncbi:MAG: 7-cyano-7-deazaguanine reductase [Actinomycetia bacterium]|nr:7-cyano-7-deazaguanine reductase [Actinomycetes bacterium]
MTKRDDSQGEMADVSMLGRRVDPGEYGRLEFFEVDSPVRVTFRTDELEALCPAVEGVQPDIYNAEISYTAQTHAVESKSLKLWLVTFRDRRIFAEYLALEIHDAIAHHSPSVSDVSVRLTQNPRGGITTVVEHPPPGS